MSTASGDPAGHLGPGGEPPTAPASSGEATAGALWPRYLVVVLGVAGLAYGVHFFQSLQSIVAPVFLAMNLVIVAYPLQRWLVRVRVPRFLAAMVTVVVVLVVLLGFFGLTAWSIAELVMVIPEYSEEITATYGEALAWLSTLGVTSGFVEQQLAAFDVSTLFSTVGSLLSNVSLVLTALITVIMAVFFVAMDSMSFPRRLQVTSAIRPRFGRAMQIFAAGVRRYWVVATIFGLIVAVLDLVALWIIGVPLALVWGVLAFLTNYIPNIGFVIGLVPPALMALVSGGWWDALWVVIAYSVLNFVIQSIIQPKFTGESVGVTPFMSFLSLLFWYWVLGWMGALLALPATLLLKALLVDADPRARWVNNLIASDLSTGSSLPVRPIRAAQGITGRSVVVSGDPGEFDRMRAAAGASAAGASGAGAAAPDSRPAEPAPGSPADGGAVGSSAGSSAVDGAAATGTGASGAWPDVEEPAPEELVMRAPFLRPPEQVADESVDPDDPEGVESAGSGDGTGSTRGDRREGSDGGDGPAVGDPRTP
ncbi:AI-2E family transporter [Nocardia zapadnayensis]|nr:AI-2E family transporter [Nocardia zapadnayensis]MCX0276558.1 AI-2E family transporter [Nocardia zapadnayensis]